MPGTRGIPRFQRLIKHRCSGNQSGLTADRMLTLSRAGQAAGLTFNQASESLAALVNAGVRGGEQFDAINQSVARFASASGVEVDKVAEAFGKLTTDPTSGLMAMARQFRNVTAEQIAYVAQLQRWGMRQGPYRRRTISPQKALMSRPVA